MKFERTVSVGCKAQAVSSSASEFLHRKYRDNLGGGALIDLPRNCTGISCRVVNRNYKGDIKVYHTENLRVLGLVCLPLTCEAMGSILSPT